jgi:hypothetical protein
MLQEDIHEVAGMNTGFASNLAYIQLTVAEQAVLSSGAAMWGRPEVEGGMLGQTYEIKLR